MNKLYQFIVLLIFIVITQQASASNTTDFTMINNAIKKEINIKYFSKNEKCEISLKWNKGENKLIIVNEKGNDRCIIKVIKGINNAKYSTFKDSGNAIINIKP